MCAIRSARFSVITDIGASELGGIRLSAVVEARVGPALLRMDPGGAASRARATKIPSPLADAIRRAVIYADLFDWPLSVDEIHRFLPVPASGIDVREMLDNPGALGLEERDGLFAMAGRGWLVGRRRELAAVSARTWPAALSAAAVIGRLPFIRSVAITGSLAMGASEPGADVDLFIITARGRLWLARAATIAIGRLARLRGIRLCPNYLLSETSLTLPERDTFTAHELAQMVPISGFELHRHLLEANGWYRRHLPNHRPIHPTRNRPSRSRHLFERALRGGAVDRLERWEMRRKVARLSASATSGEQRFDANTCKGHFDGHRLRALELYAKRCADLGLPS